MDFHDATYKEKLMFVEQILESIEILLKQKYLRKNDKTLSKIKAQLGKNLDYYDKNTFISKNIDKRIKFFAVQR